MVVDIHFKDKAAKFGDSEALASRIFFSFILQCVCFLSPLVLILYSIQMLRLYKIRPSSLISVTHVIVRCHYCYGPYFLWSKIWSRTLFFNA